MLACLFVFACLLVRVFEVVVVVFANHGILGESTPRFCNTPQTYSAVNQYLPLPKIDTLRKCNVQPTGQLYHKPVFVFDRK